MTSATSVSRQLADRIRSAVPATSPWPYAYLPDALPSDLALRLSRSLPRLGLAEKEKDESTKSYRLSTAAVGGRPEPLDEDWRTLLDALHSDDYRDCVAEHAGRPLADARLTVDVWEYGAGDWLSPHTDKPEKIITQIFYLTESWTDGDGGRLLILDDPDPTRVVTALPPVLGSSTILPRSATSWHAVEPPAAHAPVRRSVTATFWC